MSQGPTQYDNHLDAEARPVDIDSFADDLKPGSKLLDGHYTILGFLNSGGFGITYLAMDSVDRTVVIKECFPSALCRRTKSLVRARSRKLEGEYRSFVDSFIEEAHSLARLVHPNIVGVHQVFEDNATAYMVIDFIDGRDLQVILDSSDRPFTPDDIVMMLKKVLSAVEFIHQVGILHRDISPDNILVNKAGNPILIDFGAASEHAARPTRVLTGRRVIKEGYSPQEFYLTGAEQSPSSDLYSLAATFYHVITGKAPPGSQSRLARIAEGTADSYAPLAGRFDGFPRGFLESIDRAVRVMPRERIQSAGDWLDWLQRGETGAPLPSEPERPKSRTVTRPRSAAVSRLTKPIVERNLGLFVGAGAILLGAVVVGLLTLLN